MLSRRLVSTGLRLRPPVACRSCAVTYIPSKKPFVYYTESENGERVPLDLESKSAPKWNDNGNEKFWREAEAFCADQPNVGFPEREFMTFLKWSIGLSLGYFLLCQPGSAGRAWCDGWVNSDARLTWLVEDEDYMSPEDFELIAKRREIARKLPLATRLGEIFYGFPVEREVRSYRHLRGKSRYRLGEIETGMRRRLPQQFQEETGVGGGSLIMHLDTRRLGFKPEITDVGGAVDAKFSR